MWLVYRDNKYVGCLYNCDHTTASIRAALFWGDNLKVVEV